MCDVRAGEARENFNDDFVREVRSGSHEESVWMCLCRLDVEDVSGVEFNCGVPYPTILSHVYILS